MQRDVRVGSEQSDFTSPQSKLFNGGLDTAVLSSNELIFIL